MSIGTTKLFHIAILVYDLEKAITNWESILNIKASQPFYLPPSSEVPSFTDGNLGNYSDCRLATIQLENCVLEIVQPGENAGPWRDMLDEKGEGVQHISFVVPDRKQAHQALQAIGSPKPYHIGYWPGGSYSFTDSVPQLGIEINIKTEEDNAGKREKLLTDPDFHKKDL